MGEKGYFTIRLTNAITFDALTSQHKMAKVYTAYCQKIVEMLEARFNNPKSLDDYRDEKPNLFH